MYIEIEDELMKDALKVTGAKTKREAVELGLRAWVRLRAQEKARELKGKSTWDGDLNAIGTDRWSRSIPASGSTISVGRHTAGTASRFPVRRSPPAVPNSILHADRDFLPFSQHLGLKVAYAES